VARTGVVTRPPPNTSLIFPRSLVPQLRTTIPAGNSVLASAVLASPNVDGAKKAWTNPPTLPDQAELSRRRDQTIPIKGWTAAIGAPPTEASDGLSRRV